MSLELQIRSKLLQQNQLALLVSIRRSSNLRRQHHSLYHPSTVIWTVSAGGCSLNAERTREWQLFAARFMKGTCIAPSRATRADAHQAKGVKCISIDKPYSNPAIGLATLRQAAPVEAASPLILPRCDLSGAASLIIMSKRGNAKIEVRFRTVNAANSPG